jgi:predicted TIM-barrel fold metal-dependent hydrolase
MFLRQLSTDEYAPLPYSARDEVVVARTRERLIDATEERRSVLSVLANGRAATAAGLRALNEEWGEEFYRVPDDAVRDDDAAAAVFDGPELVIDVQTHFMAPHCLGTVMPQMLDGMMRAVMPAWWTEMDDLVSYDLGAFIRNVFLECETGIAVLTSGPGLDDLRHLFNDEMAATRALVDGLAGTGRLLNHAVVHPNVDGELEAMEVYRDELHPAGWKVYTLGVATPEGAGALDWSLTDDDGHRFLERARALDVKLVCAHKGISLMADNGSPRDVGPSARAFPDLEFVIYHSGYELPFYAPPEGPYTDETADQGVNRLIRSVNDNGITRGGNVYAELGTTWFSLIRRPEEAAHVLGKLIATLGEDNVVWGTDSIWYGSTQPLIDAFRVFQIPDRMCEQYGYQPLTPEVREKILSLNAARLYEIDVPKMKERVKTDSLGWARELLRDYEKNGFDALR